MARTILIILMMIPVFAYGQSIQGTVTDKQGLPLINAHVHWLGSLNGTNTNNQGEFEIISEKGIDQLVISYIGYRSDTLTVVGKSSIKVELMEEDADIEGVTVQAARPGVFISSIEPIKTQVITQTELAKAACCDLAGCFSTEGSVQSVTTNIVTNAKELRVLGLSGVYNQVLFEGIPALEALTYTYGISSIPGTLVDNIFVSKGTNSVLQGYESIAGQLNVLMREPGQGEKFLFNAYMNSFYEKQLNANYSHEWNKWSTLLSAHTAQPGNSFDRDKDSFLDLPHLTRYSVYNKWRYGNPEDWGWNANISWRFVSEKRIGGQTFFEPDTDKGTTNAYGQIVKYQQPELFAKASYKFDDRHKLSFQSAVSYQDQESYFGTVQYQAEQVRIYANLYHELIWKDAHNFKLGASFRQLNLDESIAFGEDGLDRNYDGKYLMDEYIPSIFAENILNWNNQNINLITGIRMDHHNKHGWQFTPRAHFKMNFAGNSTIRLSVGTGWRTAKIFSENINLMASSRDIVFEEELKPEKAYSYGVNFTQKVKRNDWDFVFTMDLYHTEFSNQIFPDYDANPSMALINNFEDKSASNGFQFETVINFQKRIQTKLIYNYLDVYRKVEGEKLVLPFNATHRFTGTFSYKPQSKKWHADMNLHWFGEQKMASTENHPPEFQRRAYSDPYTVVNAQLTKVWKKLDVYVGCENLFDFRQKQPIVSWEDPFGSYFDTSSVWGPTKGREVYVGLRFKI